MTLRVRGALFYSIVLCTIIGIPLGVTQIPDSFIPVSLPRSLAPTFLQFDFKALLNMDMALTIFALVFMDIFNTVGTLIGAAAKTEMMDSEGNVKNIKQAMMADALATSIGAVCGTSTVTTFVESGAGIAEGGRTGMTALSTAVLFILALFLSPLFLLIPSAATTGALVLVRCTDAELYPGYRPHGYLRGTAQLHHRTDDGADLQYRRRDGPRAHLLHAGQAPQRTVAPGLHHPLHRLGTPHPALHPRYIIVERTPSAHNEEGPSPRLHLSLGRGLHTILREDTSPFYKSVVSLRY